MREYFLHEKKLRKNFLIYSISNTIAQSYTRKYPEFVAICIVTSVQHK